jgi:hypothetical protein
MVQWHLPNRRFWLVLLVMTMLGLHMSLSPGAPADDGPLLFPVIPLAELSPEAPYESFFGEHVIAGIPKGDSSDASIAAAGACEVQEARLRDLIEVSEKTDKTEHTGRAAGNETAPPRVPYFVGMREPPKESQAKMAQRRGLLLARVAAEACRAAAIGRKLSAERDDEREGKRVGAWGRAMAKPFASIAAAPRSQLNVLMLILDDLRPDLALYGHARAPPTPRLDSFASSARVFRRAYSQFPDCAPSRSSFLTGLRPDNLGIDSHDCTAGGWSQIPGLECRIRSAAPGVVSLPEHFRNRGYVSLSYGKVFHQGLDDDESW